MMCECINELNDSDLDLDSPFRVINGCAALLVERSDMRFVRGLIDFPVLATEDETGEFGIGVEIKARVAHRTDQQSHSHVANIFHLLGCDWTPWQQKQKCFQVQGQHGRVSQDGE